MCCLFMSLLPTLTAQWTSHHLLSWEMGGHGGGGCRVETSAHDWHFSHWDVTEAEIETADGLSCNFIISLALRANASRGHHRKYSKYHTESVAWIMPTIFTCKAVGYGKDLLEITMYQFKSRTDLSRSCHHCWFIHWASMQHAQHKLKHCFWVLPVW